MSNTEARQAALERRDHFEFEPTSLVSYQSKGKILALGDSDSLASCADLRISIPTERSFAPHRPGAIESFGSTEGVPRPRPYPAFCTV